MLVKTGNRTKKGFDPFLQSRNEMLYFLGDKVESRHHVSSSKQWDESILSSSAINAGAELYREHFQHISKRTTTTMTNSREPIAVIGISCLFANGINSQDELWNVMQQSRDVGSEIPAERFNVDAYRTLYHHQRELIHAGYFLETKNLNEFDPSFFGLSDREALTMDPCHRLLMKKFVHLIEDANYSLEQIRGSRTSVYIGQFTTEHAINFFRSNVEEHENFLAPNLSVYNASARLSYHFNLQGPNFTLDTACSSSLQAIQLAVQSLRERQADLAVAGGTNLNYTPETFFIGSTIGALSPDGRSRAYSADANGYAKGLFEMKRKYSLDRSTRCFRRRCRTRSSQTLGRRHS